MFDPFSIEDQDLDDAIANVYNDMKKFNADSEEYRNAASQLTVLYALKNQTAQLNLQAQQSAAAQQLACDQNAWQEEQDDLPFYKRVSPDTALTVAGSLVTALIVIKYEQTGVISSKAMSFMRKF